MGRPDTPLYVSCLRCVGVGEVLTLRELLATHAFFDAPLSTLVPLCEHLELGNFAGETLAQALEAFCVNILETSPRSVLTY